MPEEQKRAYDVTSSENMRSESAMIAEMEADGKKVVRRDMAATITAELITPKVVHLETHGDHSFYPNAVAELYQRWKAHKAKEE